MGTGRSDELSHLLWTLLLTSLVLFGGIAMAWGAWWLDLLERPIALLIMAAVLPLGMFVYARRWMRRVPAANWRALQPSDLSSAVYFLPPCALSWGTLLTPTVAGWRLWLATGVATALHVVVVHGVLLRMPHVAAYILRQAGTTMHPGDLRKEYELRRHYVLCLGRRGARRRAHVRKAAIGRRTARRRPRRSVGDAIRKKARRIALDLTDVPAWLTASLASASLFAALLPVLSPGPVGAVVVLSPFLTIPVAAAVHRYFRVDPERHPATTEDSRDLDPPELRQERPEAKRQTGTGRRRLPAAPRVTTSILRRSRPARAGRPLVGAG